MLDEYPIDNVTPLEMCHIDSPGMYTFFLPNGTYHVATFMDSNNNSMFDDGEPIGLAINKTLDTLPDEILIAGSDLTGVDLVLQQYRVKNLDTNKSYITIQSAIDDPYTLPGHTIYVKNGTYYENVVVDKTINLTGENKNTVIIDGGGSGDCIEVLSSWTRISNLSTINSGDYSTGNAGIEILSSFCTIDNCDSYQHGFHGLRITSSSDCNIMTVSYTHLRAHET